MGAPVSPNVVERTAITWTSFEDRFSIAPRTVPVSGRPATPPEETIKFNVAGYRVTPPAPEFKKRGRPARNPNAGRRSEISIEHCTDGGPHEWRSHGKVQEKCHNCPRTAMKSRRLPDASEVRL